MLDRILGLFSRDIGIDLGTANTLVHVRDRGIVMSEPSRRGHRRQDQARPRRSAPRPSGWSAGRRPTSSRSGPLRDGVISDFDVTEQMIKYFVDKVHDRVGMIPRPRMLLGIPSGVTEVEKRAVRDAALNAGARWARLIEEPMAAAIGAGLPGQRAVRAASSSTSAAGRPRSPSSRLGGIVVSRSIRIGGDEMDQDIVTFARREYNLFLGERTAEDIKIAIGSAYPGEWDAQRVTLRGRDLLTGLPRSVEVGADQIREAIEPSVAADRRHRSRTRSRRRRPSSSPTSWTRASSSPAAARCWPGLDRRVAEATQMPVHVADDPLTCVARGTGVVLQELDGMDARPGRRRPTRGRRAEPTPTAERTCDDIGPSPPGPPDAAASSFTILLVVTRRDDGASRRTRPCASSRTAIGFAFRPIQGALDGVGRRRRLGRRRRSPRSTGCASTTQRSAPRTSV